MNDSGWDTTTLENIIDRIIDYRGKTPEKTTSGIPLITAKIVKDGFIQTPTEFIAESNFDNWMVRGLPKIGDVLLTMEAPLGEVAQITDERVALAQRLVAIRGKKGVLDNTYLKYFLQSEQGQNVLRQRESGTTVLGIKQSELRKIEIPVPPFSEQRAIADVLSALDDKIELNCRMNLTLEKLAQTLFKHSFIENHESKGWKETKLSEICTTQYGFTASSQTEEVGPRFLRITDMNKDPWIIWAHVPFCKISEKEFQKYKLCFGDILVSRMADPGKAALIESNIDSVFASYLVRLKMNNPHYSYFIFYFLRSSKYLEYSNGAKSGSVQSGMNAKIITAVNLKLPPEELAVEFENQIIPIRKKINSNLDENSSLTQLRDTLLPKLMSGQVKVKDIKTEND